jgi:hypothetical protein
MPKLHTKINPIIRIDILRDRVGFERADRITRFYPITPRWDNVLAKICYNLNFPIKHSDYPKLNKRYTVRPNAFVIGMVIEKRGRL